jgi:hypothetical protein
MDLSAFVESLRGGLAAVPPIVIALVLLAGPTAALIAYRLVAVARRVRIAPQTEVVPLWVCHDCRSVNELRVSRCYHCGRVRGRDEEVEVLVDQPVIRRAPWQVPAGSPFAAIATGSPEGPGVPVMADGGSSAQPVAVGPGRSADPTPAGVDPGAVDAVEAQR